MMTSKKSELSLCSLLFETTPDYSRNLQTLLQLIEQTNANTIILAHEVCLTGFDYENLEKAIDFSLYASEELLRASKDKTVVLTMLEKRENEVYNMAKVFHNGELVHERAKMRLFKLGSEEKYMCEGEDTSFEIFELYGIKIALLICFELRFKELWRKAEGADLILVPSWWGEVRKEHFATLTKALALMNECYLVASDALNPECSGLSAIITPQGEVTLNGNKPCLKMRYNQKNIALMRRYIDIGIK